MPLLTTSQLLLKWFQVHIGFSHKLKVPTCKNSLFTRDADCERGM